MFKTLLGIIRDNWQWRKQIRRLSGFELVKQTRGAAFGWAWLFIKPAIYIFCFWFALDIGLRSGRNLGADAPPYILWLVAGIIPWFFMQNMLGRGVDVLHRYTYLVNKIKFPLSCISTVYVTAVMAIQLVLQVALLVIYFGCGMPIDPHLLQVPVLIVLMFIYWDLFSILFSQLSAISSDVANLMKALSTPFFWLSGVIFNVDTIKIGWMQIILMYNPVTIFIKAFRDALYYQTWVWEDPRLCFGFAVVFVVTLVCAVLAYRTFNEEVSDVL